VVVVASRRKDGIYKGALAKRIMLRPPPTFRGAVVRKRIAAYQEKVSRHELANAANVERQRSKKLALLFEHYGIADKKDVSALAWALAVEHVPGFKFQFPEPKLKRGRKKEWDADRLEELCHTVESIKKGLLLTDRQALKFMVNNQQHAQTWGAPKGRKGTQQQWIETLETRLQEAKTFRKLNDQAERELQAIAASMKFRK